MKETKESLFLSFSRESVEKDAFLSSIGEKADLLWQEKKLTFQVLDPTLDALSFAKSVESLGFFLIWIIPERIYKSRFFLKHQPILREAPIFFHKDGKFFDRFPSLGDPSYSAFFPIEINRPISLSPAFPKSSLPKTLQSRLTSSIYFQGDLVDRCLNHPNLLEKIISLEERNSFACNTPWIQKIQERHTLFLKHLLEKSKRDDFPL